MAGLLLDTNVVSELRKAKPHGAVLAWLADAPEATLQICAMTVAEIQAGIELTRRQDRAKAEELERWLDRLTSSLAVLPIDAAVARCWARLMDGHAQQVWEDAMIAAVAKVHGLTVVTRNVKDFAAFGVPLIDPFATPRR